MNDCIFCKISKGKIPCYKVYEDDDVLAFLEISPVNKGHCLVIPKEHFETVFEIPDEILKKLVVAVKKVSNKVKQALNCEKVILAVWGEDVSHAHMHIIPRYEGDGMEFWKQGKYEEREAEQILEKIKSNL
ncbi:MAG: HIT family protein [Patescibacteria group bacterium]